MRATKPSATLDARLAIGAIVAISLWLTSGVASAKDIKLCLVVSKTGDFADSAKDLEVGFMIGLDFATKGTMKIGDDTVSVVVKDDRLNPELARTLLVDCYEKDKTDIAVGPAGRIATATMPLAEQRKKILITLDGRNLRDNSSRYVFHAGLSSWQDTFAEIAAIPASEDVSIGMLIEDAASARSMAKMYTAALASLRPKAKVVTEEYAPSSTTNLAPYVERLFSALKDRPGKRLVALHWVGAGELSGPEPAEQLVKMKPERFNITLATRAMIRSDLDDLKSAPGAEGSIFYYYEFPKNPANDWLKTAYRKYSKSPPDVFAVQGFAAASATIAALARAGATDTEKLIATMEGMSFETPKGPMTFRKDDHQVLQDMYHWRMGRGGKVELVATIAAKDIPLPVVPPR